MNASIYVSMPSGPVSRDDIGFFSSAEALWQDYSGRDRTLRNLDHDEFIEAVEDTEVIEEKGWVWYKDQVAGRM